ncbi:MFS transporter [Nocardia sp. KC 131]|uniref:MFS transporter n=1 Tax=Nocardia arseniciresistens TaxID=3392119 RepID=UPI00398E4717
MTSDRDAVPVAADSFRPLVFSVYVPTLARGIGMGAGAPVMTLTALDLGASTAVAGLAVALVGLGQVLGDIPAGQLVAKVGERTSIIGGTAVGIVGVLVCLLAPNIPMLCAGLLIIGLSNAVWGLARMTYLAEAIPLERRARVMSLFGGSMRLGFFIGPFLGAVAILGLGTRGGFVVELVAFVIAGVLMVRLPVPGTGTRGEVSAAPMSLVAVVRRHRRVLSTLGAGVLLLGVARASRDAILPLWADHIGMSAATASLIFGVGAALEVVFAYPAGHVMDRFGRGYIAVPALAILAIAYLAVPLTHSAQTLGVVAVVMGIGNGISNGLIMVLGADVAPAAIRAEFLAAWRLDHDAGAFAGPLLIGVLATAAPLAVSVLTIGAISALGAMVMGRYIPEHVPWPPPAAGPDLPSGHDSFEQPGLPHADLLQQKVTS